jgi:hypothetical protein
VGGDGSEAGKVDQPAPIGTTVTCDACHNPAATALTSVTFPSGAVADGLGPEARCMVCHQGRASTVSVNTQIETFKAADKPDNAPLPITEGETTRRFGFINIHYFAAAATLYGSEAHGAYEYDGKVYDVKFDHTEGYDTCVDCHNPHTTEVKVEECAMCHEGVASVEDLKKIRMVSSAPDYDGDGNVEEGMGEEIAGLQAALYTAIQTYAKEFQGSGIMYDSASYPYWFNDRDGDSKPDLNDKGANQSYNTWTPRLLKAAYNYQVSVKDPGNFAHGNKYVIQFLYDSIEDLNASEMVTKVDMAAMHRNDAGHFAGNTEAFRHWDAEEMTVPGNCAKCHTAGGLPQFVEEGANISVPASNGFLCSTCHDEANWPANYQFADVTFPSGKKATFGEGALNANLCLVCHQGRESNTSVTRLTAGKDPDVVDEKITFRNVHYFAAGATLFGADVEGMAQYEGKTYAGRFMHAPGFETCVGCHDPHALGPKVEACAGCHAGQEVEKIRMASPDYDGDAADEGIKGELETFAERLYAAIQSYAKAKSVGIVYVATSHPYFFLDADGDGKPDKNDKGANVNYNTHFTPRLLKGAYNYQYFQKDPGAFVHNAKYVLQAMYDSIQDLGGDVTGLTRPE